jgi:predicted GH43/DUF377 family glycosyl hydrolase
MLGISRSIRPLAVLSLVLAGLLFGLRQAADSAVAPLPATRFGFPLELVAFTPDPANPLFTGAGEGHWDVKIRERGWVMREGDAWHLWYTGYDGTREGIKQLGYATSPDGVHWNRYSDEPLLKDVWVEDMTVVKRDGTYYMFAEGKGDRAHLLTSSDRVHWEPQGTLDVRLKNGEPISAGPFGTPTIWVENDTWYLFYERIDAGVWLATSKDLKVWTNVQDEPLIVPGPDEHDRHMIAINQVIKHNGHYYGYYHGTAKPKSEWNTNVVRSPDLIHWEKYRGNPIIRGKSSGQVLPDGATWRLYTTHENVDLFHSEAPR